MKLLLPITLTLVACDPTPPSPTLSEDRSATVIWGAPRENADGTPLTDLAGFRVYRTFSNGSAGSGPYEDPQHDVISRPHTSTSLVVNGLEPGLHYFQVTAVDESGNESEPSPVVMKEIQ